MNAHSGVISVGVAGALGPELIADLARVVEDAGFHALWVNDTPSGDALGALAAAAQTTERLVLGTGVLPLDRHPVDKILETARHLPEDRTVLGLGSGKARDGALELVRGTVRELRQKCSARLLVGALGPRMRRLAATEGDGALFNWLTPAIASAQAAELKSVSPGAQAVVYIRTALDAAAETRLEEETAAYAAMPAYAANFKRLGINPSDTVLWPDVVAKALPSYLEAADEIVLRAVTPGDRLEDYVRFVNQAARAVRRLAED